MISDQVDSADTGFHPHRTDVVAVRRRPSPLDLPPQSWAVLGLGSRGMRAFSVLAAVGIPVVGYDPQPAGKGPTTARMRFDHRVIALAEIDDIDAIAVTSRAEDTGEINTDYFSGVVVATGSEVVSGGDAADLLPDPGSAAVFSPYHPAVLDLTRTSADLAEETVAQVVAQYARRLADTPREGLAIHRDLVRGEAQIGLAQVLAKRSAQDL